MTPKLEICARHEWVIPSFGAEDERVCRKCRVTAEEVTRAEEATVRQAGSEPPLARGAK
jgi:hypothetical protein